MGLNSGCLLQFVIFYQDLTSTTAAHALMTLG